MTLYVMWSLVSCRQASSAPGGLRQCECPLWPHCNWEAGDDAVGWMRALLANDTEERSTPKSCNVSVIDITRFRLSKDVA